MSEPDTLNVRVTAQGMTVRYAYDLRVGSSTGDSPPLEMEYTVEVDPGQVRGCRARIGQALTRTDHARAGLCRRRENIDSAFVEKCVRSEDPFREQ